ncbi:serine/threonine-protein kinase [Stigmatella sp. ncwal1]|uniref:Serine/threonine-protein kinase n=1 Tax=Stigmatella ashevillensis TaxID=2995309 RepID=A0ABT5DIL3_9BACT|nr:serine/threonine-protein kinase [Stigmatella ashevillena]
MACPSETTLSDLLGGGLLEGRKGQVLAHVEQCVGCQRALAAGASSLPDGSARTGPVEALAPGSTLSRYVVLERIGQGAMGVVYAARDPELDRRVALKVLRPDGRQVEELRRRLLREAQALARLSDPHVIAVHDVGTCGEGVFLTMDLVEGATLAEWLRQPRSWREVLRVFRDAGRGLAAAHAAGLVHRDFKPANVLVGRDGRVRVTDFGLASSRDEPEPPPGEAARKQEGCAALTRTGALLGTPAYMAPELMEGRSADALSDQFSFCVALYEALYGVRPFEGRSLEELGQAAREGRVRRAGGATRVPGWVRRVVLRGLRPRPEERFSSMEALLEAVRASRSRHARAWTVGAVALAGLLGMGVEYEVVHRREAHCRQEVERLGAAWSPGRRERTREAFLATRTPYALSTWEQASTALEAYAARWRTLRAEACLQEDSSLGSPSQMAVCLDARLWRLASVAEVLERADAETVQHAQQLVASLEGLAECKEAPVLSLRPQPPEALRPRVNAARRKLTEAQARLDAGRYSEGLAVTAALLQEVPGLDYRPLEAEVLVVHGQLQGLEGALKEAEESFYRALWAAEAGRDDEMAARVWIFLIWIVGEQGGRTDDTERVAQHARAAVSRLGQERFPAIASDLSLRLGVMLLNRGLLEQADGEFSRGLVLSRESQGSDSLRTSYFVSSLGRVRSRQGRHAEALALYRQAEDMRERLWGREHPALALNLNNIAIALLALGQREEALAAWHRSLMLLEASRPPEHPSFAAPLTNLAAVQRSLGQLEEARRSLERALVIVEHSKGKDHPRTASVLSELGKVAQDSHRLDEALAYQQEALRRVQRALGQDTPLAAAPLTSLGEVHLQGGRHEAARRDLTRALQLREKETGREGSSVPTALRPLGLLELSTGAYRKAIEYCERALEVDERVQGGEAPDVALDLTCLAEVHLARGNPAQATPLLERAQQLHAHAPRDPLDEAWTSFLLARALLAQRGGLARARATALAGEARTRMEGLGLRAREKLRQVVAWQRRAGHHE